MLIKIQEAPVPELRFNFLGHHGKISRKNMAYVFIYGIFASQISDPQNS